MKVESPRRIRNVAVTGHNDTGKTTLVSALLYASGATPRLLKVDDGNTLTDFDQQEVERKISIGIAPAFAAWDGHKINLLDCPGYGIFFTETRAGMRAADTALLCDQRVAGIEVNTEKVWQTAEEHEPAGAVPPDQDGPRAGRLRARRGQRSRSASAARSCRSRCRSARRTASRAWSTWCATGRSATRGTATARVRRGTSRTSMAEQVAELAGQADRGGGRVRPGNDGALPGGGRAAPGGAGEGAAPRPSSSASSTR